MSFPQSHNDADMENMQLSLGEQEVHEEVVLPLDRSSVQPDTYNTMTDESVDGATDPNGDLDWADEELSMSFHDGADGTMTPYTERLFTDGSVTPMTEASWMDESMTPSSCPGTPDAALDLPLLQTPTLDRVSASGHVCVFTLHLFCCWCFIPPPRHWSEGRLCLSDSDYCRCVSFHIQTHQCNNSSVLYSTFINI